MVQSHPQYRDRTTLIFTADHGRGRTAADWTSHGKDVPGAEETFIVTIGPDIRLRGELGTNSYVLGHVAGATVRAVRVKVAAPALRLH
jgi:hypothetical protein